MERVNDINRIAKALEESRSKLNLHLSTLGWKEGLFTEEKCVKCSVNKQHSLPASSYGQHVYKCKLKSEGIDPKDVCPSSHFFYKNSLAVVPVIIDKKKYDTFKDTKESINPQEDSISSMNKDGTNPSNTIGTSDSHDIPLTMSASSSDLSSTQRKVMYDYVIQTAKAIKRRAEDELDDLDNLPENTEQKETYKGLETCNDVPTVGIFKSNLPYLTLFGTIKFTL
ncbi:hypothetical protein AC249_AIPGENE2067 [Exaiptasia diaphana]|nr:hypothetical protein AC249_AIPGENE2067 [Exaiptasia diaphana]